MEQIIQILMQYLEQKKFKNEEEKKNKKALELLEIFDMKILAEQKHKVCHMVNKED